MTAGWSAARSDGRHESDGSPALPRAGTPDMCEKCPAMHGEQRIPLLFIFYSTWQTAKRRHTVARIPASKRPIDGRNHSNSTLALRPAMPLDARQRANGSHPDHMNRG
ncbi:hypothetical protein AQ611_21120 [Burkholderia singularis]|nr:hypothetical protein AQ611_21120 [Burkholderia sp. Bp7605]